MIAISLMSLSLLSVQTAGQTSTPAPKAPAVDRQDEKVCKRFVETGSLVKGYKTCKTRREWDRETAEVRSNSAPANSCRNSGSGGPC
ncbi:hypothetical protein TPR58_01175 [Sphingomonas sp. HF-S3]|uniref:Secreted protein n=1 Tax=Sphingomonas rustica TaxID=3103142 RepID=A0ABV0B2D9_9SPHN